MEAQAAKSTHPILIIAGIAVTVFSLAGIAAIMGWIPSSKGQSEPAAAITAPATPPIAETPAAPAPAPVAEKPKPAPHVAKKAAPRHEQVARNEPAAVPPPPPAPVVAAICHECGTIGGIHEIDQAGQGSGGGAVAGGLVGGVAGHQMGNGRGRDLMTVLGAVGGAVAGNAIEKKAKTTKEYQVLVNFEDGSSKIITLQTAPAWRVGDKVKVVNGVIESNG